VLPHHLVFIVIRSSAAACLLADVVVVVAVVGWEREEIYCRPLEFFLARALISLIY